MTAVKKVVAGFAHAHALYLSVNHCHAPNFFVGGVMLKRCINHKKAEKSQQQAKGNRFGFCGKPAF